MDFLSIRKLLRQTIPLECRIKLANGGRKVIRLPKTFLFRLTLFTKKFKFLIGLLRTKSDAFIRNQIRNYVSKGIVFESHHHTTLLSLFLRRNNSITERGYRSPKSPRLKRILQYILEIRFSQRELRHWKVEQSKFSAQSKKVLLVIGTLGGGGAERQLCYLASEIKKLGWNPVVAVNNLQGDENRKLMPLLLQEEIEVVEFGNLIIDGNSELQEKCSHPIFINALRLSVVLNRERPQVVHSWMDYANCESLLVKEVMSRSKFVLGLRSVSPNHFVFWSPSFRPIYRRFVDSDVKLVANSNEGLNSYKKWLKGFKGYVIPNGVDVPVEKSNAKLNSQGIRNKIKIVGVMRLSEEKGPDIWIEIAKRVTQIRPNVEFHLFGSGPMEEELLSKIDDSESNLNIRMHGFVGNPWSHDEWDIHLSTSRAEGMPNAVMEASLCGIPTVGFAVGGIPEILGQDCIFLSSDLNIEQLFKNVVYAIDFPDARKIEGLKAKEKVTSEMSVRMMALRYIELYGD